MTMSGGTATVYDMTEIVIEPATADRFDDAEHALTGGGDGASCQCQWWPLTNAELNATTQQEREDLLAANLAETPSPALIAYVDGEAAGWVRVGPRTILRRLPRTRDHHVGHGRAARRSVRLGGRRASPYAASIAARDSCPGCCEPPSPTRRRTALASSRPTRSTRRPDATP